jgi:hypothetical protein
MPTHEFTVIGGGLAGLIGAIALAEKGARVRLLERSAHLGGRAATQHHKGFALNMGAHALYRNGPLFQVLKRWAIPFSGGPPTLQDSAYLVVDGRRFTFPSDAMRLSLTGALSVLEKFEAANLLRKLGSNGFMPAPELTVQQWLNRESLHAPVRKLAEMLIRLSTYCNEMTALSAAAAVSQVRFGIQNKGVLYLDGGWGTLIDGLSAKAQAKGVTIETGKEAASLDPGTILAVPPEEVERLTGVHLPTRTPVRAACLDLGLRSLPKGSALFAMDLHQPLYLSVHSASARLAPEGSATVQIARYLQSGEKADRGQLESFADLLLPGWRGAVEVARFLPNMIVSHAIPRLAGRASVRNPALPGIAIAGDWVGTRHMLADAAAASALEAAEAVWERRAIAA